MDNNKPYNEFDEQFNNLPLPNEEQSWQQMKQMLDEDDRKRRPVIPVFLKSCAGWGLALSIVSAVLWFTVKPQRWWQKETSSHAETSSKQIPSTSAEEKISNPIENGPGSNVPGQTNSSTDENLVGTGNETTSTTKNSGANTTVVNGISTSSNGEKLNSKTNNNSQKNGASSTLVKNSKRTDGRRGKSKFAATSATVQSGGKSPKPKGNAAPGTNPSSNPVTAAQPNPNDIKVDRSIAKDSLIQKETQTIENITPGEKANLTDTAAVVQKNSKKNSSKSKWIYSAGIGLQQQIPVGGQEAVPYDYYGRSGSLSDYIPSVYARMEKENKWFIQGEFRYGAPQTLKDFQYSKQTKVDTSIMTVTTFRLKKTYYHQLPFSFNYYVLPNWTVGVGGIYNRFYGAVTEKEVKQTNLQTQVETLSREIVNIQHFNDSFLYKTQVHALVQTEYHWKRFDFGLRYTKDIQPYIKYTQPDGQIDVKKNQTFQFLVRYRIWQSMKKISG